MLRPIATLTGQFLSIDYYIISLMGRDTISNYTSHASIMHSLYCFRTYDARIMRAREIGVETKTGNAYIVILYHCFIILYEAETKLENIMHGDVCVCVFRRLSRVWSYKFIICDTVSSCDCLKWIAVYCIAHSRASYEAANFVGEKYFNEF